MSMSEDEKAAWIAARVAEIQHAVDLAWGSTEEEHEAPEPEEGA